MKRMMVGVVLVLAGCAQQPVSPEPIVRIPDLSPLPATFQRGMNLEPIRGFGRTLGLDRLPASLDALADLGVDHVAIIPSFFQARLESTAFDWRGGRAAVEAETRAAIALAHERDLAVLLKPHLWLADRDSGAWRGDIDPGDELWPVWRDEYRDAVLGFARLAAEESVAGLSIGSELRALTDSRPEFWADLATEVRAVFPGFITYAANWDREFDSISFWPALDYVGVDAFWPLVDSAEAALDDDGCDARMGSIRDRLAAVAARTGRPVLLTEIGYKSSVGALWKPWEWSGDEPDASAQAAAWNCIARVLGGAVTDAGPEAWLHGLYAWNWHADLDYGGLRNTGFTPRGKPAEGILGAWFRARLR